MKTLQKINNLFSEIENKLKSLALKSKKQSKHQSGCCLQVKECQFNLEGGRYLDEITGDRLLDNHGYQYNFHVLSLEQLSELYDEFYNSKNVQANKLAICY